MCNFFCFWTYKCKALQKKRKEEIFIKELTSKEKLFCTYCSLGLSAREAAAKSGYAFGEKSGLRLLRKKEIKKEIRGLIKQRRDRETDIALGCERLAFGCVSDAVYLMFADEVSRQEIEEMDLFNISEIKRKKGGDIEIKFFDRLKAMEMLDGLSSPKGSPRTSSVFSAIEKGAKAIRMNSDEQ